MALSSKRGISNGMIHELKLQQTMRSATQGTRRSSAISLR
jgi:hypothetical protein